MVGNKRRRSAATTHTRKYHVVPRKHRQEDVERIWWNRHQRDETASLTAVVQHVPWRCEGTDESLTHKCIPLLYQQMRTKEEKKTLLILLVGLVGHGKCQGQVHLSFDLRLRKSALFLELAKEMDGEHFCVVRLLLDSQKCFAFGICVKFGRLSLTTYPGPSHPHTQ
jgi:hypothetical protein